jgi:excisionase family DNA binding protein
MTKEQNNQPPRPWLSAAEVASILGTSEITVRRHCYSGLLPSKKFGRALRIPASAVIPA